MSDTNYLETAALAFMMGAVLLAANYMHEQESQKRQEQHHRCYLKGGVMVGSKCFIGLEELKDE
jgi:D-serine dehydratase